jgi:hypothetical protein
MASSHGYQLVPSVSIPNNLPSHKQDSQTSLLNLGIDSADLGELAYGTEQADTVQTSPCHKHFTDGKDMPVWHLMSVSNSSSSRYSNGSCKSSCSADSDMRILEHYAHIHPANHPEQLVPSTPTQHVLTRHVDKSLAVRPLDDQSGDSSQLALPPPSSTLPSLLQVPSPSSSKSDQDTIILLSKSGQNSVQCSPQPQQSHSLQESIDADLMTHGATKTVVQVEGAKIPQRPLQPKALQKMTSDKKAYWTTSAGGRGFAICGRDRMDSSSVKLRARRSLQAVMGCNFAKFSLQEHDQLYRLGQVVASTFEAGQTWQEGIEEMSNLSASSSPENRDSNSVSGSSGDCEAKKRAWILRDIKQHQQCVVQQQQQQCVQQQQRVSYVSGAARRVREAMARKAATVE